MTTPRARERVTGEIEEAQHSTARPVNDAEAARGARWAHLRPRFAPDLRRFASIALLGAGLLVWSLRLTGDGAEQPTSPASVAAEAGAISDAAVAAWAKRVGADGRLPDPVLGRRGDYGAAMLLGAIARRAFVTGDQRGIADALHGLAVQAEDPSLGAFELLAYSSVYRWAQVRLVGDPKASAAWRRYAPAIRSMLAARASLSGNPRIRSCFADPACFGNQKLVGAAALVELLQTGIAPAGRQSLLFGRGERYRDLGVVLRLVAQRSGTDVRRAGASVLPRGGVLSDPPRNPTAYHALSVAMLGRLISELERQHMQVPGAVRSGFQRASSALMLLAAPDGDLSYLGRGQAQVWVPAVTVDAAAQVLRHVGDRRLRGAALALAATALERLRSRYQRADGTLSLLPDDHSGPPVPIGRATDHYAAVRTYNGLAVWALDDAAAILRSEKPVAAVPLPAASDGVTIAPRSNGLLTITSGPTWLAVATSAGRGDDARYGPGVLALRSRQTGRWVSMVPERPFLAEALPTLAIEQNGDTYLPSGVARPTGTNSALVEGDWRLPAAEGRSLDAMRMRWTAARNGETTARWRMEASRMVVARALVPDGSRTSDVAGGIRSVSHRGATPMIWQLLVDGVPAAVIRSRRSVGGSSYAAGLVTVALRAVAPAGSVVEFVISPD